MEDDGPGLTVPTREALTGGIGLSSTRERLERLYPDDHTMTLAPSRLGGLSVCFDLPYEPMVEQEEREPGQESVREAKPDANENEAAA